MKLKIKKEFFDKIIDGKKTVEFRDAHITFVCEETGRTHLRIITGAFIIPRFSLPEEYRDRHDLFKDDRQVGFILGETDGAKN